MTDLGLLTKSLFENIGALFRHISQKCSGIHQVFPVLFVSSAEKIALVFCKALFANRPGFETRRLLRQHKNV